MVSDARTAIEMSLSAPLAWVAERVQVSPRTLQRAYAQEGTSFWEQRQAAQLDRAALVLLERSGRGQGPALRTAARAAGERRPRHLCRPFQQRYGQGVTPGRVWQISCSVRELHAIAKAPYMPARKDPARYQRRRRRIERARARLRQAERELVPGTVVTVAITAALRAVDEARLGRPAGRRSAGTPRRARRRGRAR